jgi:hypothetical protein
MNYLLCFVQWRIRSISSPSQTTDDQDLLPRNFPLPRLRVSSVQVSEHEDGNNASRFRQADRADPSTGRPLQMGSDHALYSDVQRVLAEAGYRWQGTPADSDEPDPFCIQKRRGPLLAIGSASLSS